VILKRVKVFILTLLIATNFPVFAQAQTFDSVSHIHSVKAFGSKVLMGTHEGLFLHQGQNKMKPIGSDPFDVMGLDSDGSILYASGHPSKGSKLPNPVGLLKSVDGGVTWSSVSLLGKVDFHFLEASGAEIYGASAFDGQLMYSSNSGKKWVMVGKNSFSDIAILSGKPKQVFAVEEGKLFRSNNAFKTRSLVKTDFFINAIEMSGRTLWAASGKSIYNSANSGKSWSLVNSFELNVGDISISKDLVAAVVGNDIFTSIDQGKRFKKS
jgi:photosystem II stability/assembly factor-like uncharacterized protein